MVHSPTETSLDLDPTRAQRGDLTLEDLRLSAERGQLPQGVALPSSFIEEPLQLLRVQVSGQINTSELQNQLQSPLVLALGRLLASALAKLPAEPAERAQLFTHQDGSIDLSLSGATWSLTLSVSQSAGLLESSERSTTQSARVSWREIDGEVGEANVQLSWEPPITPQSEGEIEGEIEGAAEVKRLTKRWSRALSLGMRAQTLGVAHAPPEANIHPEAFLHPSVEVSGAVHVGAGAKIWHFSKLLGPLKIGARCSFGQNVVIERGVEIGENVKVQNNVSIYSGVILEDDVFCGPSMVFTNVGTPRSHYPRRGEYAVTRVGRGASIGANATIVCGHQLGRYCFVGAGAVVTRDVPDFALVYGNPARIRGWACYCGVKLDFTTSPSESLERSSPRSTEPSDLSASAQTTCVECGRSYEKRRDRVTLISAP